MVSYEYIAGFFDGEGHITISYDSKKNNYFLVCSIANTNKQVLDEIQKVTGGHVIFHKGSEHRHPHYRLSFYTKQAYDFIRAIHPHVIVKRMECDIALEFVKSLRPTGQNHYKLTAEELEFRERCKQQIMALHGNRMEAEQVQM